MKKNLLQITLALAAALCARGQGTLQYDQQSSTNESTLPRLFMYIQTSQPMGQSFTPSLSSVGFIRLYLAPGDTLGVATIYVNLWAGSIGTGTLLGSTAPVSFPEGLFFNFTNFFFVTPPSVTPGATYYFQPVVQSAAGWDIGVLPGSAYANGTAFFNGVADNNLDLWFREGIVVPEPSSGWLILFGVIGLYAILRRRNDSKQSQNSRQPQEEPCTREEFSSSF